MKALSVFSFVLGFIALVANAAERKNVLPGEVSAALAAPDKVILYSLEPWARPRGQTETLHRFKVLGKTELNAEQGKAAIAEFQHSIRDSKWAAACFDPRHAIRVYSGQKVYDLLLCYACGYLYVYQGDETLVELSAGGSPKVLNGLLRAAGVELSKSDSEEDRAARRKQEELAEARWLAAMPKSLQGFWPAMRKEGNPRVNLKPYRAALSKEFPEKPARIRALFTWFGSGAGPWSGVPGYELIAEGLLLDFSTADLVAAAQRIQDSESEMEGAARLIGGWDFGQRRSGDRKKMPASLKEALLAHARKSVIKDNVTRANYALGSEFVVWVESFMGVVDKLVYTANE